MEFRFAFAATGFLDNPTCRLEALSISRLLDAIGLFTVEELVETELVRFIAVGLDFATILFSSDCFLHPLRHPFGAATQPEILGAAERTEMADIEQTKKIIPFVTCDGFMAGFAGYDAPRAVLAFHAVFCCLSAGPRSSASWSIWTGSFAGDPTGAVHGQV